ncbi:cupin domain-containing protein [Romeria aff. gracilis LEGE 07310]|uniref:Cupin domain-containing protein n=1 Tax=Vasconcelosia minhoensis LEGE 07310 TaxID=915328 RepID=A0A8J7AB74_9CYAN|nr:cupin domain-containing protein [Romeria gracilis]MBE9077351.1 cupin domain-containing protein [Romeria aff. gracilis LEGE 07310]
MTRVKSAIAWGNSTDSELCILFGKMNPGTAFPAHTHPDPRITTVLAGTMYYGIGEQFDRAELRPYPVGTVVYTPAGTPHFMWTAGDESMMQETEVGPTGLSFVAGAESGQ